MTWLEITLLVFVGALILGLVKKALKWGMRLILISVLGLIILLALYGQEFIRDLL